MEASHPRKRAKLDVAARVSHLFVKGLTGRSELQSVELVTERGCRGCDHENELSPRQVLACPRNPRSILGLLCSLALASSPRNLSRLKASS